MHGFRRILVIDDQDDIREIAALSLVSGAGWEVLCAASGREGIEVAVREQPEAVLMYGMMPSMDGQETLARLRTNPATRAIPVLFLTAKVNVGTTVSSQGVILKPFDPLTLADDVAAALGWAESSIPPAKTIRQGGMS